MLEDDAAFASDDFFEISNNFYGNRDEYFQPAATDCDTVVLPGMLIGRTIPVRSYVPYLNDEAGLGLCLRRAVAEICRISDGTEYEAGEITIAPSITSASLNLILFFKSLGIRRFLVETPAYYGTLIQLKQLDLDVIKIPTYYKSDFRMPVKYQNQIRCVYWLTQPRISLSRNQNIDDLLQLIASLEKTDSFMVVDEATELDTPALLDRVAAPLENKRIFRLRSLLKPLSINGHRFAYICHSSEWADCVKENVWISHGGIDRSSAEAVFWASENADELRRLKIETKAQCRRTAKHIQIALRGSEACMPPYENGYTTNVSVNLERFTGSSIRDKRDQLIIALKSMNVFPTLSPSMYFAIDGPRERIRINLLGDINKLTQFASELSSRLR